MLGRLVGWIATVFDRAEAAREEEPQVEGSGEPYHDPAYSGAYTATRRLERMQEAAEEREEHDELRRRR